MREGKKEPIKRHDLLKENSNSNTCDTCGSELTKLETFIGELFQEGKKFYYHMYWKVICDNCGELCVKESKLETMNYPVKGRYHDRSSLGGW